MRRISFQNFNGMATANGKQQTRNYESNIHSQSISFWEDVLLGGVQCPFPTECNWKCSPLVGSIFKAKHSHLPNTRNFSACRTNPGHKEPKLISWLKKHESKIIVVSEKSKNPATKRQ